LRLSREFTDSDVYKLIEVMSWEQGRLPTAKREQEIQRLIATSLGQAGFRVDTPECSIVFDLFISHYPLRLATTPSNSRTFGHTTDFTKE